MVGCSLSQLPQVFQPCNLYAWPTGRLWPEADYSIRKPSPTTMNDELELSEKTHDEIKEHCAKGDALAEAGKFKEAIGAYNSAWKLIPEPKNQWEASAWVLAAIGDAAFLGGFLQSAKQALEYGITCPGAIGNPFMHLRFGQILLDLGERDCAADELMRAYIGAGVEIFERDNPKYLTLLKTRATM
jgi:tetratricopeptide (TPR) repeat protein